MEALWALGLALKERREGQQLGEGTPKGEYNRLSLHKAVLQEVQAEAIIPGPEPSQLAVRVLEPYAIGVLKRHLEAVLQPKGKEIRARKAGTINFGRGWCPTQR